MGAIQQCIHEGKTLLLGKRFFQQFIVDAYTFIEEDAVQWFDSIKKICGQSCTMV